MRSISTHSLGKGNSKKTAPEKKGKKREKKAFFIPVWHSFCHAQGHKESWPPEEFEWSS